MHRTTHATVILLFAVLAGTASAGAQEEFTLQYKLAKGKVYRLSDSSFVKNSQEMMGQEMKSTSVVLSTIRMVPTDIKGDGSTVLTVSPDAMTISFKNSRIDTTIGVPDMIGKRTRLTISRLGETLKKETIDTLRLTGLAAQAGARQDLIRLHVMPSKPVRIGSKWTSSKPDTSDAMGGRVITLATGDFTLVAKESRMGTECLKITYTGKLKINGKGSMQGADFFVEGNGTTSGTYFVDVATGMPVMEDSNYDIESTVALTGAQNMTIPSSSSVSMHRILLKE